MRGRGDERARSGPRLAWTLVAAAALLHVAVVAAAAALGSGPAGAAEHLEGVVAVAVALVTAAAGAVIISRIRGSVIGWLLVVIGVAGSLFSSGEVYFGIADALHRSGSPPLPGMVVVGVVSTVSLMTVLILPITVLPLLFPTGRPPSPRWRPVAWLAAVAFALTVGSSTAAVVVEPEAFVTAGTDVVEMPPPLGALLATGGSIAFVAAVLALASLAVRWRASHGVVRQQLKWLFAGVAAALLAVLVESDPLDRPLLAVAPWLPDLIADASRVLLPLAVGVALTRHRLYEIDRLVNRTVVYGIVTGLLVAVYVLLVGAFQAALAPATGDSALAVAAATLLVAAAFGPVRRRVQDAVDRRFNRTRYDAVRAAESFRASLRGEVDGEALSRSLREVVTATVEPASVALWLRPRQRDGGALSGRTGYRPRITS